MTRGVYDGHPMLPFLYGSLLSSDIQYTEKWNPSSVSHSIPLLFPVVLLYEASSVDVPSSARWRDEALLRDSGLLAIGRHWRRFIPASSMSRFVPQSEALEQRESICSVEAWRQTFPLQKSLWEVPSTFLSRCTVPRWSAGPAHSFAEQACSRQAWLAIYWPW